MLTSIATVSSLGGATVCAGCDAGCGAGMGSAGTAPPCVGAGSAGTGTGAGAGADSDVEAGAGAVSGAWAGAAAGVGAGAGAGDGAFILEMIAIIVSFSFTLDASIVSSFLSTRPANARRTMSAVVLFFSATFSFNERTCEKQKEHKKGVKKQNIKHTSHNSER